MAYDIARQVTTGASWSRDDDSVVTVSGEVREGLSKKKIVVGALVGAAAVGGLLMWRGRGRGPWRPGHGYHKHPMARTIMVTRSPSGRMVTR